MQKTFNLDIVEIFAEWQLFRRVKRAESGFPKNVTTTATTQPEMKNGRKSGRKSGRKYVGWTDFFLLPLFQLCSTRFFSSLWLFLHKYYLACCCCCFCSSSRVKAYALVCCMITVDSFGVVDCVITWHTKLLKCPCEYFQIVTICKTIWNVSSFSTFFPFRPSLLLLLFLLLLWEAYDERRDLNKNT